jgi:excisionase family DNA binding protein
MLKSSQMLTRQFLSVKEVADLLKVGEVAVRSWIRNADLRAVNVGREWRIAPADLESFLQRHANRPSDDAPREGEVLDAPGDATESTTGEAK